MRKILTIFLVMMFVMVGVVSANTLNVAKTGEDSGDCTTSDCLTIGYAISQASLSDTITVAAGTYDEQVLIDKSLTLQGVGDTTIIRPPAMELAATTSIPWIGGGIGTMAAIVSVETTGGTVNINNLKIDGSLIPSKTTTWLAGLVYLETGGIIDSVTVIGNPLMPDRTAGIFASALTNTVNVEVARCAVEVYNRAGIYALGDTITANYHHNVINGPVTTLAGVPNGIFFLRGATGSATYNIITDLGYTGETYRSTGIGTYNAGVDVVFSHNEISYVQNAFALSTDTIGTIVEYNDIHDCHTGVRIEAGAANSIIQYNDIHNNDFAMRCGPEMGDGNVANYNKFVNNLGLEWTNVGESQTYVGAVSNVHDTYVLNAEYNWWGVGDGPSGVGPGSGDSVSTMVDYDPWDDDDGILDGEDRCLRTVADNPTSLKGLGTNRWIWDGSAWITKDPKGVGPQKSFTMEDTQGCSCEQILAGMGGKMTGHSKFGCSISVMEDFIVGIQPILVDTVLVYAIDTSPTSSNINLESGVQYELEAMGTAFAGGRYTEDIEFDAEYSITHSKVPDDTWTDNVSGYESYGPTLLDLFVDGNSVDWGAYNPEHTYYWTLTGAGAPVKLLIYDIHYPNNVGSITVNIFEKQ